MKEFIVLTEEECYDLYCDRPITYKSKTDDKEYVFCSEECYKAHIAVKVNEADKVREIGERLIDEYTKFKERLEREIEREATTFNLVRKAKISVCEKIIKDLKEVLENED